MRTPKSSSTLLSLALALSGCGGSAERDGAVPLGDDLACHVFSVLLGCAARNLGRADELDQARAGGETTTHFVLAIRKSGAQTPVRVISARTSRTPPPRRSATLAPRAR